MKTCSQCGEKISGSVWPSAAGVRDLYCNRHPIPRKEGEADAEYFQRAKIYVSEEMVKRRLKRMNSGIHDAEYWLTH